MAAVALADPLSLYYRWRRFNRVQPMDRWARELDKYSRPVVVPLWAVVCLLVAVWGFTSYSWDKATTELANQLKESRAEVRRLQVECHRLEMEGK